LEAIEKDVLLALDAALTNLEKHDAYLFTVDANERSITHHLAKYLELEIRKIPSLCNLDVDAEYNRNGVDAKKLLNLYNTISADDTQASTVFPDIVVHKRGTNDNNLLVVEAKKIDPKRFDESSRCIAELENDQDLSRDCQKLVAYQQTPLCYAVAVHVLFRVKSSLTFGARRTKHLVSDTSSQGHETYRR
jgi:hypothetical protein